MKLFLLDAYALIYRSYYAFIKSPRVNSKGLNTSAVFGFVNTLEELLRKENPTHIAVAFDPPGGTFRHDAYEQYKAQRQETPEDIRIAVPIIKEIIAAYNIKELEVLRYEADDVIGTIAKKAEKEGFDVYMMTPDKDYGQLTSDHIFMYKPKFAGNGFDTLDAKAIMEKYELSSPEQMIDLLGLMGDASDNIPGCPGVGPKTAQKLLEEYGSIENLLENTKNIKGTLKLRLEENKEQIIFSKFLATIKTDVPIDFKKDEYKRREINAEKIAELFEELEFRTLINRVLKKDGSPANPVRITTTHEAIQGDLFAELLPVANQANETVNYSSLQELKDIPHTYHLVEKDDEIADLAIKIAKEKSCCFDTETTGLDPTTSELVGMSFAFKEGEAYYVAVPADFEKAKQIAGQFRSFFEDEKIQKVGQNLKYDIIVLKKYGIHVKGPLFDTMIAHYLLNPELRHNMDYMAETFLNYKTIHIDELIGARGKNQLNMRSLRPEQIKDYACEDADVTLKLKAILEKAIEKQGLEKLLYEIELPLIYVLADMEYTGVRLDTDALAEYSKKLTLQLQNIEQEIFKAAESEFNINSAKQVGEVLFDKLKIVDKPKKTKTGQYVTSEETLESMKTAHPIVGQILDYRGLKKLLSTYIDALPLLVNPVDEKVHTSYNQTVTATGRLSSSNPNLQNIPIREDQGREIRKAFIADEGCVFFSADYSQIELRIMAHLSKDPNMVDAFNSGEDIHAATAAKIFKLPIKEVTGDMRRKAKTANFGIIYGISVFGLAERLSIPRGEAKELIDGYFETYPKVKEYMDNSIAVAREKNYVETVFGRKRYLPDINSRNTTVRGYAERNAINAPIQGSAADIIKVAMNRIFERFERENIKSKMILQVHDELNFNVIESELPQVQKIVMEEMENAYKLVVPLKADCGKGKNWLEAH
ncbi:DNA polymerase-1 [Dysgonomonas sp. PFB1-18]|uniref:DNA polymerase I n=1 Tax=unclassified Dysgonomonas TaxID=2630389 RepID=UPI0024733E14|nr:MULTISPECIES: DNA polymerase I [unclassified Dysgonomonas]MDH6310391.1 DNA polymerase-1 [Dysgonomonas sp. PF1-14]MDH6340279.1 DNA polymerase-1 [Dysgonomonas sp. PF1-16]MDH6381941.1 DNA polymerase-1 [Dysgonomonas sp. PFB1-18]MDH6399250.1 DNA polymerase-1 [Dysgonomonas sp. PF1-23]